MDVSSSAFKKIRIKEHKDDNEIIKLFEKRRQLRRKSDVNSKQELSDVETMLAEKCAENNYKTVQEEIKDIEEDEAGFNSAKLWKLKKKLSPETKDAPVMMCDSSGNKLTSSGDLKEHILNHYKKVLSNRPINKKHEELQKDKEDLCNKRIEEAKLNKSDPWKMEDLEKVLKYLKKKKSRDPNDLSNELFHYETAGADMKIAILHIMNKIKDDLEIPKALEKCNITSIHKKGRKNVMDNYRGVFRVTVLRNILDRLLYNDIYPVVDRNLTDANVGARKDRNIRDNLFVLNAVMNSVTNGSEQPCELGVYDLEKAFDSLWAQECVNDLYDAGCKDDKLVLMHLENQNASVAAKTSKGITERININNVIMQGTVTGGLCCTTTTDKLAKLVYNNEKLLYKYKGSVSVPPLLMIDDILTISECGMASVAMNATVNTFIETKKLKLKQSKCSAIHVGRKSATCPDLKVHGEKMHKDDEVRYLGDIIHKSGKSKTNTKERVIKANAIAAEIKAILSEIPLGKYRIQVGIQLREAMFLNGVLFNSEVWPKLTATEISTLENVDHQLLRSILKAHAKTPTEFLFLETGCVPLKYVMANRRLMYLKHILSRDENELIKRVYEAQKVSPTKGDFSELVNDDLKLFAITEEDITTMSKSMVKTNVKDTVLEMLQEKQKLHSKTRNILYSELKRQTYITDKNMNNSMVETLVAWRSSMVRGIAQNFAPSSQATVCPLGCRAPDTQQHLLQCPPLLARLTAAEGEVRNSAEYDDIYRDVERQRRLSPVLQRLLELREDLLQPQDLPVGSHTGPSATCSV